MTDALVPTDEERAIEAHARRLAALPHDDLMVAFADTLRRVRRRSVVEGWAFGHVLARHQEPDAAARVRALHRINRHEHVVGLPADEAGGRLHARRSV